MDNREHRAELRGCRTAAGDRALPSMVGAAAGSKLVASNDSVGTVEATEVIIILGVTKPVALMEPGEMVEMAGVAGTMESRGAEPPGAATP